jgi:hypothetical protein
MPTRQNDPSGTVISDTPFAITPSDTVNHAGAVARRIYVGGAGVVQLVTLSGAVVAFTAAAGTYIDCVSTRVNATGTTATLMVGLI